MLKHFESTDYRHDQRYKSRLIFDFIHNVSPKLMFSKNPSRTSFLKPFFLRRRANRDKNEHRWIYLSRMSWFSFDSDPDLSKKSFQCYTHEIFVHGYRKITTYIYRLVYPCLYRFLLSYIFERCIVCTNVCSYWYRVFSITTLEDKNHPRKIVYFHSWPSIDFRAMLRNNFVPVPPFDLHRNFHFISTRT